MVKIGDKIVCIKLGKRQGSLTLNNTYTVIGKSGTAYVSIINDLGSVMSCDMSLFFEPYNQWLAKVREQQMKSILDD